MISHIERNSWLEMDDDSLMLICEFTPFKSTGRGGQKKNKSSSAVRLVHKQTGIAVTATKSRSQHENRKLSLKRLKFEIAFQIRSKESVQLTNYEMSPNNKRFYLWVAYIFDLLERHNFAVSNVAKEIGLSTSRLIKLLARDPDVWQHLNNRRRSLDLKDLKR